MANIMISTAVSVAYPSRTNDPAFTSTTALMGALRPRHGAKAAAPPRGFPR